MIWSHFNKERNNEEFCCNTFVNFQLPTQQFSFFFFLYTMMYFLKRDCKTLQLTLLRPFVHTFWIHCLSHMVYPHEIRNQWRSITVSPSLATHWWVASSGFSNCNETHFLCDYLWYLLIPLWVSSTVRNRSHDPISRQSDSQAFWANSFCAPRTSLIDYTGVEGAMTLPHIQSIEQQQKKNQWRRETEGGQKEGKFTNE